MKTDIPALMPHIAGARNNVSDRARATGEPAGMIDWAMHVT
jgi:hypothetical protein